MRKSLRIIPYKMGSQSARNLAIAIRDLGFNVLRVHKDSPTYKHRPNHVVLNWGSSLISTIPRGNMSLNSWRFVRESSNKIAALKCFRYYEVSCPDFTEDINIAKEWINEGCRVYCRSILNGHSGAGIVVANTIDELVSAPLYTKGVKAGKEFRVHVFKNPQGVYEVIHHAKKGRRVQSEMDSDYPSHLIRNHASGWVFLSQEVELPEVVREQAIKAVQVLGLDFGAVDVATIKNTNDQECVIYEVNSSPGLCGVTLTAYRDAIVRYLI